MHGQILLFSLFPPKNPKAIVEALEKFSLERNELRGKRLHGHMTRGGLNPRRSAGNCLSWWTTWVKEESREHDDDNNTTVGVIQTW